MRRRWSRAIQHIAIMTIAGWLAGAAGTGRASGQTAYNPVFTGDLYAPAGSLEQDIFNRLAYTHRYDWRDLPRLARMTVLESIALYESMLADLPNTLAGARVEGEMSVLWNAAEYFYIGVTPADAPSLVRSRPLLANVEAAYERVDAILAETPVRSQRVALHLYDLSRLLPAMNALIDTMESDLLVPAEAPAAPALDIAGLREQARRLADDMRGAARSLGAARPEPPGRDALIADLGDLVDLVEGFDRLLATGPPVRDAIESLKLVRSRLWPIEARYLQVATTPDLAGRWRSIRQRVNAISDRFDRSRVISLRPVPKLAAGVDRRLLAQADRAVVALDAFLANDGSSRAAAATGSAFPELIGRLRRRLLLFRQQVAAGESPAALAAALREIEDLNRRLGERARVEARIFRGTPPSILAASRRRRRRLRSSASCCRSPPARPGRRLRRSIALQAVRIVGEEPVDTDLGEVTGELAAVLVIHRVDQRGDTPSLQGLDDVMTQPRCVARPPVSDALRPHDFGGNVDRIRADHVDGVLGETMNRRRQQDAKGMPTAGPIGPDDIIMIKRGDQHPIGCAGRRDDFEDPGDDACRALGERLDLDVRQPVLIPGEEQRLFQRRDPHRPGAEPLDVGGIEPVERAEVAGRAGTAVAGDEPGTGVEGPNLIEVEVRHAEPVAIARVAREADGNVGRSQ